MKTISKIEKEVDQTRLKIYEETKDITPDQYKEHLDRITKAVSEKYGFKVFPA